MAIIHGNTVNEREFLFMRCSARWTLSIGQLPCSLKSQRISSQMTNTSRRLSNRTQPNDILHLPRSRFSAERCPILPRIHGHFWQNPAGLQVPCQSRGPGHLLWSAGFTQLLQRRQRPRAARPSDQYVGTLIVIFSVSMNIYCI